MRPRYIQLPYNIVSCLSYWSICFWNFKLRLKSNQIYRAIAGRLESSHISGIFYISNLLFFKKQHYQRYHEPLIYFYQTHLDDQLSNMDIALYNIHLFFHGHMNRNDKRDHLSYKIIIFLILNLIAQFLILNFANSVIMKYKLLLRSKHNQNLNVN